MIFANNKRVLVYLKSMSFFRKHSFPFECAFGRSVKDNIYFQAVYVGIHSYENTYNTKKWDKITFLPFHTGIFMGHLLPVTSIVNASYYATKVIRLRKSTVNILKHA